MQEDEREQDYFTSGRPLSWQEAVVYALSTAWMYSVSHPFGYVILAIGGICFVVDGFNSYVESKLN